MAPRFQRRRCLAKSPHVSITSVVRVHSRGRVCGSRGAAGSGGDKASWLRRAFHKEIPERFPRVKAVVWFNANKEEDWRVDSSPDSLEAYREVAASTFYRNRLP